jgi:hypothetical protein
MVLDTLVGAHPDGVAAKSLGPAEDERIVVDSGGGDHEAGPFGEARRVVNPKRSDPKIGNLNSPVNFGARVRREEVDLDQLPGTFV